MIRSLQWRLQLWHALVLVVVLTIFGAVVYYLQWQTRLQQIDADLDRSAEVLTMRLRMLLPPPPWMRPPRPPTSPNAPQTQPSLPAAPTAAPGPNAEQPPDGAPQPEATSPPQTSPLPAATSSSDATAAPAAPVRDVVPVAAALPTTADRPPGGRPLGDRAAGERGPGERPPGERGPGERGPGDRPPGDRGLWGRGQPPQPGLQLPEEFKQLFEGSENTRRYFLIWNADGQLLEKSASAPNLPFPGLRLGEGFLPARIVRQRDVVRESREHDQLREVVHASRYGMNVLVGRSISLDLRAQRRSALFLLAVGASVLAVGLFGGWWFTVRVIRPLRVMAQTAESISVRNLSQRIDVRESDSELGQLGVVLNRAFERLQSAFEQQTRFTADASHELRTPLSVILANADLALSRPRTAEEYRETLETCRRASRRMRSIIESLLALARFDAGIPNLNRARVDLTALAAESVELLRPLADQRAIRIETDWSPAAVDGDRDRLAEVLSNLLSNAIRYNQEGGTIRVAVRREGDAAVVSVSDTGIGIPPAALPHIFERFYRVDPARSRADGGCGLGLAICQTIVEAHGGAIHATSELQHGTTFEVRLPARAETPSDAAIPALCGDA